MQYPKIFVLLAGFSFLFYACPSKPPVPGEESVPCMIDGDYTFANDPELDVDYVIDCTTYIGGNAIVEAGTVIEFTGEGAFIVDGAGSLRAIGTNSEPIEFRGLSDIQGLWRGICIESSSPQTVFEHCRIANAGLEAFSGFDFPAGLSINGKVSVRNTTIENNTGMGVLLDGGADEGVLLDFVDNQVLNNSLYPISLHVRNINSITGTNLYAQNGRERIRVIVGTLEGGEYTFRKSSTNYQLVEGFYNELHLSNVASNPVTLNIEAGATLRFNSNVGIDVYGNSKLKIMGEELDRVRLIGEEDGRNYWKGIFHKGTSQGSFIEHAIIRGAAGSSFDGLNVRSSLRLGTVGVCCDRATIRLDHVEFEDADCAIYQYGDDTTLEMTNVIYSNISQETCN